MLCREHPKFVVVSSLLFCLCPPFSRCFRTPRRSASRRGAVRARRPSATATTSASSTATRATWSSSRDVGRSPCTQSSRRGYSSQVSLLRCCPCPCGHTLGKEEEGGVYFGLLCFIWSLVDLIEKTDCITLKERVRGNFPLMCKSFDIKFLWSNHTYICVYT